MIICNDYNTLVGNGVAIRCPDWEIRKFKVLKVLTHFDGERTVLDGVELDIPSHMEYGFLATHVAEKFNDICWINPSRLFRNKGDCARDVADGELEELKRKIKTNSDLRKIRENDIASIDRTLKELKKKLGNKMNELDKKKWFVKKAEKGD